METNFTILKNKKSPPPFVVSSYVIKSIKGTANSFPELEPVFFLDSDPPFDLTLTSF